VATQTIVILDFGSQYTQLIARRIREQNVFSVVLPCTAPLSQIQALQPLGIVLSGGPSSVYDADAPAADPKVLELGVPVLAMGCISSFTISAARCFQRPSANMATPR
jgi:GMP synthase (glutamine-hydrolysing)